MIDFHTHILPKIDDGSHSIEESLQMLQLLQEQAVSHVVLSPHFYAEKESLQHFLQRRQQAYLNLIEALSAQSALPELHLGSEFHYYEGFSQNEEIRKLCIDGSNLLLLEMPFVPWTRRMKHELLEAQDNLNVQIVLAHIDRYLRLNKEAELWRWLDDNPILLQVNTSFFEKWRSRQKALRLLKSGRLHLLGTDSHNLTTRPPNMLNCCKLIQKRLGEEFFINFENQVDSILLNHSLY